MSDIKDFLRTAASGVAVAATTYTPLRAHAAIVGDSAEVDSVVGSAALVVGAMLLLMLCVVWLIMQSARKRRMAQLQSPTTYNLPPLMKQALQQPAAQVPPANGPTPPPQDPRFPGNPVG